MFYTDLGGNKLTQESARFSRILPLTIPDNWSPIAEYYESCVGPTSNLICSVGCIYECDWLPGKKTSSSAWRAACIFDSIYL